MVSKKNATNKIIYFSQDSQYKIIFIHISYPSSQRDSICSANLNAIICVMALLWHYARLPWTSCLNEPFYVAEMYSVISLLQYRAWLSHSFVNSLVLLSNVRSWTGLPWNTTVCYIYLPFVSCEEKYQFWLETWTLPLPSLLWWDSCKKIKSKQKNNKHHQTKKVGYFSFKLLVTVWKAQKSFLKMQTDLLEML